MPLDRWDFTIDVRGPIGGWLMWYPKQTEPVHLIAGGSGIVPITAMIRSRAAAGNKSQFRLRYSVHAPEAVFKAAVSKTGSSECCISMNCQHGSRLSDHGP